MSLEADRVELADYARIVWKRKWMIIIPTVLVVATALVALRYMTPIYVSSSLIEIVDRDIVEDTASEFIGERVRGGNRSRDYDREKIMQLNQQVKGQPFLDPVGRRLGMHDNPGVRASAENKQAQMPDRTLDEIIVRTYTQRLKEKISVEKAGLDLYRFICEDEDPYKAYQLAKAVAEEYLDYELATDTQVTERTRDFTTEQLEEHRELLKKAERELQAHRARITTETLQQQNPVTNKNFTETRRLVDEADLEITTIQQRILRGMERIPPRLGDLGSLERIVLNDRMQRLVSELRTAERNQVVLAIQGASGRGIAGADVSRIRQDIFNEMRNQVVESFPVESSQIQNQIGDIIFDRIVVSSVEARRSEIQRLLRDYRQQVIEQPRQDLELQRLEGEVNRLTKLVESMEAQLFSGQIKAEARKTSVAARVKIVDFPVVPVKPDRPDRTRIMLLALAVGPLLGLGAVVLSEYLDTSLKTVEEVEEVLGLPVLGTIPRLVPSNTEAPRRRSRTGGTRTRSRRVGAAGAAGMALAISASLAAASFAMAAEASAGQPDRPLTSNVVRGGLDG